VAAAAGQRDHQCGKTSITELREYAATLDVASGARYLVTEFIGPELADVFAVADVVISRSGADHRELTALGKASVLIPLASSAGNEQTHNATTTVHARVSVWSVRRTLGRWGVQVRRSLVCTARAST
jgi:UDP-N-acetylglucosamine--N-acetylmuramyl-(pentapeptide) pyrophosphoryl-undecaprenol N-acetylglucosamine transferase